MNYTSNIELCRLNIAKSLHVTDGYFEYSANSHTITCIEYASKKDCDSNSKDEMIAVIVDFNNTVEIIPSSDYNNYIKTIATVCFGRLCKSTTL